MSAFDAEGESRDHESRDHLLPAPALHDAQQHSEQQRADADNSGGVSAQPACAAAETHSIAGAAMQTAASIGIQTAASIASSLRALVPLMSSDTRIPLPAFAPHSSIAAEARDADADADADAAHCRRVQESVDMELSAFRSSSRNLPLLKAFADVLQHNYMRVSFALLLMGLFLLRFM